MERKRYLNLPRAVSGNLLFFLQNTFELDVQFDFNYIKIRYVTREIDAAAPVAICNGQTKKKKMEFMEADYIFVCVT